MKRSAALLLSLLLLLCGCAKDDAPLESGNVADSPGVEAGEALDPLAVESITACIQVEGYGEITLELYPQTAPQSVSNFCYLARQGFYDGLTFHRIISGFMIQGGDPNGDGSGGPGYSIKGEFSANGVENSISHERGVISMARSQAYDSAGSQFFIMHADNPGLDGSYAAFGRVTEGMDVVDAIAGVLTNSYTDKPYKDVVITTITIDGPLLQEPEKLS